jgi:hypothetical protein
MKFLLGFVPEDSVTEVTFWKDCTRGDKLKIHMWEARAAWLATLIWLFLYSYCHPGPILEPCRAIMGPPRPSWRPPGQECAPRWTQRAPRWIPLPLTTGFKRVRGQYSPRSRCPHHRFKVCMLAPRHVLLFRDMWLRGPPYCQIIHKLFQSRRGHGVTTVGSIFYFSLVLLAFLLAHP